MSIWNKVLTGLILLASVGFFILGARALKTHEYWRTQAKQLEQELATEIETHADLSEQVRQVGLALHEQLVDRGRTWRECRVQPNPQMGQSGVAAVAVEYPAPHQIAPKSVLWIFDDLPVENGGRYLGQFEVVGVGGQDNMVVNLKPSTKMTQPELARLVQSASRANPTWTLYEIMPIDNHESLAGLDLETLKAVLPAESVEEYVKEGQLKTLEEVKQQGLRGKVFKVDANGEIVKRTDLKEIQLKGLEVEVEAENEQGKYVRQLRDYEELFRKSALERTEGIDRERALTRNNDYLAQTYQDATLQHQYRQKERDQLAADRAKFFGQRDTVAAHLEAVKGKLAAIRTAVADTIKSNRAMAGEIARIQQEATRLIDEQTRRMARAGAP
ncbi:MAG: hypothetical protein ABIP48_05730 [Planctomycetota bacterium]